MELLICVFVYMWSCGGADLWSCGGGGRLSDVIVGLVYVEV